MEKMLIGGVNEGMTKPDWFLGRHWYCGNCGQTFLPEGRHECFVKGVPLFYCGWCGDEVKRGVEHACIPDGSYLLPHHWGCQLCGKLRQSGSEHVCGERRE